MNIRIARKNPINPLSYVDGPGARLVLFMQGCTLACPGCQSKHLWNASMGQSVPVSSLAAEMIIAAGNHDHANFTIMGGEPLQQPAALLELVSTLRMSGADHIIVYTGYAYDQLTSQNVPARRYIYDIMAVIDVLVDGPYIKELDDPFISYRGSYNQRPIDAKATLETGSVITLDWDSEIVIQPSGDAYLPAGFAKRFADLGDVRNSKRCGQAGAWA